MGGTEPGLYALLKYGYRRIRRGIIMLTMEQKLQLENFNLETQLLEERLQREMIELSQFNLETELIIKGVL